MRRESGKASERKKGEAERGVWLSKVKKLKKQQHESGKEERNEK